MATKYTLGLDQAQRYLNDPLMEPQPSDETGLNATFRSTFDPIPNDSATSINKAAKESVALIASHSRNAGLEQKSSPHSRKASGGRSRGNSLSQRYPGDMIHHPLDMLKQDAKKAHRSPHLRKGSIPGVDTIDALDATPSGKYHHEGPYDATLASRNQNRMHSPVAATFDTTQRTLNATPPENIKNAIDKHYPLDGVAETAPGAVDCNGRVYDYEEMNMMTEAGGDYKNFPREDLNDDQKKELRKTQELNRLVDGNEHDGDASGIELVDQETKKPLEVDEHEINDDDRGNHHRHSLGGLTKLIGSLRKKKD